MKRTILICVRPTRQTCTSESDRDHLNLKDIQEVLWAGRELELNSQWQRSILLGTFLALAYAGYGMLMVQERARELLLNSQLIHWQALGIALFGMVFAYLWICMAKGSKAWYEMYEDAIELYGDLIVGTEDGEKSPRSHIVTTFAGFNHWGDLGFRKKSERHTRDSFCLSTNPGGFSPSRINIAIGIVSLVIWVSLALLHILCIDAGFRNGILKLLQSGVAVGLAAILFSVVLGSIFLLLSRKIRSSIF